MAANQATTTADGATPSQSTIFAALEAYPWSTDIEFQSGLSSILSSSPTARPSQIEHLTLRARCFYYARKTGLRVDFDAYKDWRAQQEGNTSQCSVNGTREREATSEGMNGSRDITLQHEAGDRDGTIEAPYPTTFSQIVELISTGQPIPGIKEVPDTVLEGQASRASAGKRRKPWEKDDCKPEVIGAVENVESTVG